jgi:hypothetical protein
LRRKEPRIDPEQKEFQKQKSSEVGTQESAYVVLGLPIGKELIRSRSVYIPLSQIQVLPVILRNRIT